MAKDKGNKTVNKLTEYELGRYKKAVATRDELIKELRDEVAGQYEIINILSAYIGTLIGTGTKAVDKLRLSAAIGSYGVSVKESEDKQQYIIKTVEIPKKK